MINVMDISPKLLEEITRIARGDNKIEQIDEEAKRGRPSLPRDAHGNVVRDQHVERGSKSVSDDGDAESKHMILQLRKVVSTRGLKPVHFNDGKKHEINAEKAKKIINMHDSMEKPADKQQFVNHISKSLEHFTSALQGNYKPEAEEKKKNKITLASVKKGS